MLIYIIRHGETNLNLQGRLQGRVDEPLNESGRELAEVTGEALKDVPFDLVISSPLSRALETGILASAASGRRQGREIPVITDDRLMEIDWGSWDYCGILAENFSLPTGKEEYIKLHNDTFNFTWPPDGETVWDVIKRTGEFYQELIHNPEYQDKTILISTHGFAMRAMLNPLYKNRADFWHGAVPYNCAVNIIEVKDGVSRFIKEDAIFYDKSLCFNVYGKLVLDEEQEKEKEEPMKTGFVCYPKCTTCKKARKWLTEHNVDFEERHIAEDNPSKEEIAAWHERSGLPIKKFFNTSGQVYRNNNIKDKLKDMSVEEQYELLASDGMLVKRPILVTDDFVLVGFKEKEYEEKLL